jgi:signal transduction histidine kinase
MLRRSDQLSPKQLQSVEVVSEEASRLSKLLDDLLVLSRSDSGQLDARREEVQLEPLMRRLGDLLTDQRLGERLRLPRADTLADLAVHGDNQRLTQCLLNLVENADKYAPGDEPIDIEVQAADDHIDLLVRDRGPGILPADGKRVFERFQRGTGSGQVQGSGLGLSVVAMLMERMGGSIDLVPTLDADGSDGRGSTFRLRLNRAQVSTPATSAA